MTDTGTDGQKNVRTTSGRPEGKKDGRKPGRQTEKQKDGRMKNGRTDGRTDSYQCHQSTRLRQRPPEGDVGLDTDVDTSTDA